MHLNLSDVLLQTGASVSVEFREDIGIWEEEEQVVPVQGTVGATNAGRFIVVTGSAEAVLKLACTRCLKKFESPLNTGFEAECEVSYLKRLEQGLDVKENPEVNAVFGVEGANVTELICQTIVATMPLRTLCDDMCQGLCSYCGTDLNNAKCSCQPPADPRWDALAEAFADKG